MFVSNRTDTNDSHHVYEISHKRYGKRRGNPDIQNIIYNRNFLLKLLNTTKYGPQENATRKSEFYKKEGKNTHS